MKIISVRQGFTGDHSSTSYEFLAVERPLEREERAAVSSLSRRVSPSKRRASFVYHVDGYDIPGGWENLMANYYDVMCSEDYDWWTLAMAFPTTEKEQDELLKYEFTGNNDLGISVTPLEERTIVSISCVLDYEYLHESFAFKDLDFETNSTLLNLLTAIRRQLMEGDYRSLYVVWEVYRFEEEEEYLEKPIERKEGEELLEFWRGIFDVL